MSIELKRMTPSRAMYFMERFKREEKLLGPNEQAALTYVINMLEKATTIQQAEAQQTATGIEIDFKQTTELLTMFGGEPATVTLMPGDGHRGKGLYAYYTDLPEEGAEFLGEADDEAVPDQQPATGESVGQVSDLFPSVRNKLHAQGLDADAPLYTHPAPSVPDDSKRLNYLQDRGATIDLIAGVADFYPMQFRVGGLHSSANIDVRAAIDAAMLAAKGSNP